MDSVGSFECFNKQKKKDDDITLKFLPARSGVPLLSIQSSIEAAFVCVPNIFSNLFIIFFLKCINQLLPLHLDQCSVNNVAGDGISSGGGCGPHPDVRLSAVSH